MEEPAINKRFKKIILANEELQGKWQEEALESLWWNSEYEQDNEEFIDIELNSEKMKMKILLMKLAVHELNNKGVQPNTESSSEIFNKYDGLESEISFSNHLTREEAEKSLNTWEADAWDIAKRTRLASNYSSPIVEKIVNEIEGAWANRIPHNLEKISEALTLYLKSKIRDNEIDRLFLKLLSDCEIIACIEKFGLSKYFTRASQPWGGLLKRKDLIEEEEDRVSHHKDALSGVWQMKLFVWFLGISVLTIIVSNLLTFIPNIVGSIVSIILIIIWIWDYRGSKKSAKYSLNNYETCFPTLNLVEKMENFYFLIRTSSPLPVSKIKKDVKIWEDCPGFTISIPDGIKSLITDMERRGVKSI